MSVICKEVDNYIDGVLSGRITACKDQIALVKYVRRCFNDEGIHVDEMLLDSYLGLSKYFPFERLFEWQEFCIALHLCTFWNETGEPRWPDLFLLIARGAGKDGYIAFTSFCLLSPYSGLEKYDVDICANVEEQAVRPMKDVIDVLESTALDAELQGKLRSSFKHTKEYVQGRKNRGVMRGRTNNPRSRDGMRSGIVIFNEIHGYENYDNIKVFVTGQGKTRHPRRLYATTNGDVREGPLDEMLARSEAILKGDMGDNGLLPFVCRIDDKKEADDPRMWYKANPSLSYLPSLKGVMEKEFAEWKANPIANGDFMTKRMNLPQSDSDIAVTDWENIAATNSPLPYLGGWECVAGIDYSKIIDWAAVNLHFRRGDERYDINHSWLCSRSPELFRINAPWREWAAAGLLTVVDDAEISPDIIAAWLLEKGSMYSIRKIAVDNFRYSLLSDALKKIGFDAKDYGNVRLVKPSDIMKVQPVIASAFVNRKFSWGDNPPLRWAANNVKLVRSSRNIGCDTGNFFYAKIEAKSRKTDPFMALVHAMTLESELTQDGGEWVYIPPATW